MRRLHAMGLRYRVDFAPLPGSRRLRADIVFTRARVAVFLDGCYWHGCPAHYRPSTKNAEFWANKIQGNRERDARVDRLLLAEGWTVLRFWEHQQVAEVADSIVDEVRSTARVPARPPGTAPTAAATNASCVTRKSTRLDACQGGVKGRGSIR